MFSNFDTNFSSMNLLITYDEGDAEMDDFIDNVSKAKLTDVKMEGNKNDRLSVTEPITSSDKNLHLNLNYSKNEYEFSEEITKQVNFSDLTTNIFDDIIVSPTPWIMENKVALADDENNLPKVTSATFYYRSSAEEKKKASQKPAQIKSMVTVLRKPLPPPQIKNVTSTETPFKSIKIKKIIEEKSMATARKLLNTQRKTNKKKKIESQNTSLPILGKTKLISLQPTSSSSTDIKEILKIHISKLKSIKVDRLKKLFNSKLSYRFAKCEYFYSNIDKAILKVDYIDIFKTKDPKHRLLNRRQWRVIKKSYTKPRRLSNIFLLEELKILHTKREQIRHLQLHNMTQPYKNDNFDKDFPNLIPTYAHSGLKVTIQIYKPVNCIVKGIIKKYTANVGAYCIEFDDNELGIKIVPDYDVYAENIQMMSIKHILNKQLLQIDSPKVFVDEIPQFIEKIVPISSQSSLVSESLKSAINCVDMPYEDEPMEIDSVLPVGKKSIEKPNRKIIDVKHSKKTYPEKLLDAIIKAENILKRKSAYVLSITERVNAVEMYTWEHHGPEHKPKNKFELYHYSKLFIDFRVYVSVLNLLNGEAAIIAENLSKISDLIPDSDIFFQNDKIYSNTIGYAAAKNMFKIYNAQNFYKIKNEKIKLLLKKYLTVFWTLTSLIDIEKEPNQMASHAMAMCQSITLDHDNKNIDYFSTIIRNILENYHKRALKGRSSNMEHMQYRLTMKRYRKRQGGMLSYSMTQEISYQIVQRKRFQAEKDNLTQTQYQQQQHQKQKLPKQCEFKEQNTTENFDNNNNNNYSNDKEASNQVLLIQQQSHIQFSTVAKKNVDVQILEQAQHKIPQNSQSLQQQQILEHYQSDISKSLSYNETNSDINYKSEQQSTSENYNSIIQKNEKEKTKQEPFASQPQHHFEQYDEQISSSFINCENENEKKKVVDDVPQSDCEEYTHDNNHKRNNRILKRIIQKQSKRHINLLKIAKYDINVQKEEENKEEKEKAQKILDRSSQSLEKQQTLQHLQLLEQYQLNTSLSNIDYNKETIDKTIEQNNNEKYNIDSNKNQEKQIKEFSSVSENFKNIQKREKEMLQKPFALQPKQLFKQYQTQISSFLTDDSPHYIACNIENFSSGDDNHLREKGTLKRIIEEQSEQHISLLQIATNDIDVKKKELSQFNNKNEHDNKNELINYKFNNIVNEQHNNKDYKLVNENEISKDFLPFQLLKNPKLLFSKNQVEGTAFKQTECKSQLLKNEKILLHFQNDSSESVSYSDFYNNVNINCHDNIVYENHKDKEEVDRNYDNKQQKNIEFLSDSEEHINIRMKNVIKDQSLQQQQQLLQNHKDEEEADQIYNNKQQQNFEFLSDSEESIDNRMEDDINEQPLQQQQQFFKKMQLLQKEQSFQQLPFVNNVQRDKADSFSYNGDSIFYEKENDEEKSDANCENEEQQNIEFSSDSEDDINISIENESQKSCLQNAEFSEKLQFLEECQKRTSKSISYRNDYNNDNINCHNNIFYEKGNDEEVDDVFYENEQQQNIDSSSDSEDDINVSIEDESQKYCSQNAEFSELSEKFQFISYCDNYNNDNINCHNNIFDEKDNDEEVDDVYYENEQKQNIDSSSDSEDDINVSIEDESQKYCPQNAEFSEKHQFLEERQKGTSKSISYRNNYNNDNINCHNNIFYEKGNDEEVDDVFYENEQQQNSEFLLDSEDNINIPIEEESQKQFSQQNEFSKNLQFLEERQKVTSKSISYCDNYNNDNIICHQNIFDEKENHEEEDNVYYENEQQQNIEFSSDAEDNINILMEDDIKQQKIQQQQLLENQILQPKKLLQQMHLSQQKQSLQQLKNCQKHKADSFSYNNDSYHDSILYENDNDKKKEYANFDNEQQQNSEFLLDSEDNINIPIEDESQKQFSQQDEFSKNLQFLEERQKVTSKSISYCDNYNNDNIICHQNIFDEKENDEEEDDVFYENEQQQNIEFSSDSEDNNNILMEDDIKEQSFRQQLLENQILHQEQLLKQQLLQQQQLQQQQLQQQQLFQQQQSNQHFNFIEEHQNYAPGFCCNDNCNYFNDICHKIVIKQNIAEEENIQNYFNEQQINCQYSTVAKTDNDIHPLEEVQQVSLQPQFLDAEVNNCNTDSYNEFDNKGSGIEFDDEYREDDSDNDDDFDNDNDFDSDDDNHNAINFEENHDDGKTNKYENLKQKAHVSNNQQQQLEITTNNSDYNICQETKVEVENKNGISMGFTNDTKQLLKQSNVKKQQKNQLVSPKLYNSNDYSQSTSINQCKNNVENLKLLQKKEDELLLQKRQDLQKSPFESNTSNNDFEKSITMSEYQKLIFLKPQIYKRKQHFEGPFSSQVQSQQQFLKQPQLMQQHKHELQQLQLTEQKQSIEIPSSQEPSSMQSPYQHLLQQFFNN